MMFSGHYTKVLDQRTINNAGTFFFYGCDVCRDLHSFPTRRSSDLVAGDTSFLSNLGGPATINNTGSFQKSGGTGSTAIGPAFNNNGTLNVQGGTGRRHSAGDSKSSYDVAAGAKKNFAGGTMTLESNSTLTAAGHVS